MISKKRHLAKAITYRIGGSLITGVVGWCFTGSLEIGGWIGMADFFSKIILYYLHERLWYRFIKFGVQKGNGD